MHQNSPTFQVVGSAIRTRRKQAGMSAQELAAAVGVDDSYIYKLERGVREQMRPGPYTALRAALKCTDDDLLAPEDKDETR